MTSSTSKQKTRYHSPNWSGRASDVEFTGDLMSVRLRDGREIRVPVEWFPKLRDASPQQRQNWRLIGDGHGIHWPDIDEDLAVSNLLGG